MRLIIPLLILACVVVVAIALQLDDGNAADVEDTTVDTISCYGIAVLSDGSIPSELGSVLESFKIPYHTISSLDVSEPITIITSTAEGMNEKEFLENIKKAVDNGNLLMSFEADIEWGSTGLPMSYSKEAPVNYVYKYKNCMKCYSCNIDSSRAIAHCLLKLDKQLEQFPLFTHEYGGELGSEIEAHGYFENQGYGCTTIGTDYFILPDVNDDYGYVSTRYYAEIDPDNGSRNSGLDVNSNCTGAYWMMKYGPQTTSGTYTTQNGVTISLTSSEAGFSYTGSWSYSTPDVVIYNDSSTINKRLSIAHNIDEHRDVGNHTYYVEPGKLMKIPVGNDYVNVDSYQAQFCHYYDFLGLYGFYNNANTSITTTIPIGA
ncbi:MAG: hypothetical protein IKQ60_07005 [Candidatus Methanomethylophilaceae archaeon]|nr:hypothetical protein [Candidatus Methanomethylophilaceae archaeon]